MRLTIVLLLLCKSLVAHSQVTGLELAQKAREQEMGFVNYSVDIEMVLSNKKGKEVVRKLKQLVRERNTDGNQSLLLFDTPEDVKGTALLTHGHKTEPDDQWIFFPAVNRVKRISSTNKSGAFMGSEFAFEDLGTQETEKFQFEYLGEQTIGSTECYAVKRIPLDKNSGYSEMTVYYNKQNYRTEKVDYHDRKGELIKTLQMEDYMLFESKFWKPATMTMTNHRTGKSTSLEFSNYVFGNPDFSDTDFSPQTFHIVLR